MSVTKLLTIQNQLPGCEGPAPPVSPPREGRRCPTDCSDRWRLPVVHELDDS